MRVFHSVIGSDSKVRDRINIVIRKVEGCLLSVQLCVCFKLDLVLVLFCVPEVFTDCGRRRRSDAPAASLITHTCAYSLIWCVEEGRGDNRTRWERRGGGQMEGGRPGGVRMRELLSGCYEWLSR